MRALAIAAAAIVTVATVAAGGAVADAAEPRSWSYLTTGNGHGFQVFDAGANKITQFLEHPYRYLRPNPANPRGEGIPRRNLAYDVYFGVRAPGGAGWLNAPTRRGEPEYVDQSHLIRAPATVAGVAAESYFFAPFDYAGNALVALLHAPGAGDGYALFNFHLGSGGSPDAPDAGGERLRPAAAGAALVESGPGGGFMVYVPLSGAAHADCAGVYGKLLGGHDLDDNRACAGNDVVPAFQAHLDGGGWMAVAMQFVDSADPAAADAAAAALVAWAAGRAPDRLLADARAEFAAWRKPPPPGVALCGDDELRLWRQSEAVLRMAQVRETDRAGRTNHGMILASLPPGMWHIGWVRDASYAIVALARSGHFAEARAGLDFLLHAQPVGSYAGYVQNAPYRVSLTRYFGNGAEECDWDGSGPNIETDGWGLVLWASRQYVAASGDGAWLDGVYDWLRGQVGAPLAANLEPGQSIMRADSSIWESHQPGKHYAYTTMAAARGFCDLAALAATHGDSADAGHYAALAATVRTAFAGAFVDKHQALGGSLEGLQRFVYYDGALAEAFNWRLLPDVDGAVARATLDLFAHLRVDSGGFRRNDDGLSSYDNDEWIWIDLRIGNALRRAGRGGDADEVLAPIVARAAANFYLLPELYNDDLAAGPIGRYAGSIPMVGYGAGTYLLTMFDRAGAWEPSACDDGAAQLGPTFTCPAVPASDGGSPSDGGAPDDGGSGEPSDGSAGHDGGGTGAHDGGLPADGAEGSGGAACQCALGGASRGPSSGATLLLALPWLLVAARRRARRRR